MFAMEMDDIHDLLRASGEEYAVSPELAQELGVRQADLQDYLKRLLG